MVNTTILSQYRDGRPWETIERKISGGPLYPKDELLTFLADHGSDGIRQWTQKCISDLQALELNQEDIFDQVRQALLTGTFLGSQWCERHEGGPWAACDAYHFYRREWFAKLMKYMECEYYLKLAMSKTGVLLLLISFHPSR